MPYELSSNFFREMPEELVQLDGGFARDLVVMLAHVDQLPELDAVLYEITQMDQFPDDAALARLAPGLPSEVLGAVVRGALTLAWGIERYLDRDDPEQWIDDLLGVGILAESQRAPLREAIEALRRVGELNSQRARVDFGVTPAFESLSYTTEVRGAMSGETALRLTGACSLALRLDSGTPRTICFQASHRQLRDLIAELQRAERDLSSLEQKLVRG